MKTPIAPGVTPCPRCRQIGLVLDTKFIAKEPHTVSLAGNQMKLTGRFVPHLSCMANCGWEILGRIDSGYVIFGLDEGDDDPGEG